MATYLTKIKFSELNGETVEHSYGYQETPRDGSPKLLHIYDENGEQLDGGNGYFPNAKWEALPYGSYLEDSDDFWDAIESLRSSRE